MCANECASTFPNNRENRYCGIRPDYRPDRKYTIVREMYGYGDTLFWNRMAGVNFYLPGYCAKFIPKYDNVSKFKFDCHA